MDKFTHKFLDWCHDPSPEARFTRTIAQGIIAVIVSGLTTGEWGAALIVGVVMAVISPIHAEIAKGQEGSNDKSDDDGIWPYSF